MNNAIVLTNGLLKALDAKTAHGLIRGTERFTIKGVVDCLIGVLEREELLEGILYIYLFNRNLIKVNKENKIKTEINNNKIDNNIK